MPDLLLLTLLLIAVMALAYIVDQKVDLSTPRHKRRYLLTTALGASTALATTAPTTTTPSTVSPAAPSASAPGAAEYAW